MDTNEYKFYVHVVNSVKGGSGKSTFSLLLADYLMLQDEDAYIIDLDMCGTSWYSDFKGYWVNKTEHLFMSDILYAPCERGFTSNVWEKLKVTSKDVGGTIFGTQEVNVCVSAQDQNDRLCDIPEVELLEHATYHLMTDVLNMRKIYVYETPLVVLRSYKMVGLINYILNTDTFVTEDNKSIRTILSDNKNKLNDDADDLFAKFNVENLAGIDFEKKKDLEKKYCGKKNDLLKSACENAYYIQRLFLKYLEKNRSPISETEALFKNFGHVTSAMSEVSLVSFDECFEDILKRLQEINPEANIGNDDNIKRCLELIDSLKQKTIHFILDLPPSHEATAEQICHRLLFDNNSSLNKDYPNAFKINFYMMTPVDQPSAYEKNKAYIKNLVYHNRRYSSTVARFVQTGRMKICFVIIDNHGWEKIRGTDVDACQANIKKFADSEKKNQKGVIFLTNSELAFFPFTDFEFKKGVCLILQETHDKESLNLWPRRTSYISAIVDKME